MPKSIMRREVQRLLAEGAQLVEVLPAKEFAEEHIAGAMSIPLRRLADRAPEELNPQRPVIVYCFDSA